MVRQLWLWLFVLTLLQACGGREISISSTIKDHDQDGFDNAAAGGDDCNDTNPEINPDAEEICDGIDNNCDEAVDCDDETVADEDGDGVCQCDDCDDFAPENHPGNKEICDGGDNDCNGLVDCADPEVPDADNDGACKCADCDDDDDNNFPGNPEACDDADNDCDGAIDNNVVFLDWYEDVDQDGHGDPATKDTRCAPPSGSTWVQGIGDDCDDSDGANYPFNNETCDGKDNNCDNNADEGLSFADLYFDSDGDGYGDPNNFISGCAGTPGSGWVLFSGDCNDAAPTIHPAAVEACDGIDNDCDTLVDCLDPGVPDADADGYCECDDCNDLENWNFPGNIEICDGRDNNCDNQADCDDVNIGDRDGDGACECQDCDDNDAANFPGNTEICDGTDNDCDGFADCNDTEVADGDSDGVCVCFDCDDNNNGNFPGNLELCDALDNDCDGTADNGLAFLNWYRDVDGDLHGDPSTVINTCEGSPGSDYVLVGDDCDDTDAANFPQNNEACDGQDNNCNSQVDEGLSFDDIYQDLDGDGFGNPSTALSGCGGPPDNTWVSLGGDCNDADPAIKPDADETCDSIDNDCDNLVDCLDPEVQDADADGYCVCDDCDDLKGNNHPNNTEICDGEDNNCDNLVDCADSTVADADNDGVCACEDCDDADDANSPNIAETCDGSDNDCDGLSDCLDPDMTDGDGDGVCECFDCDDTRTDIYPGATELCDGIDNDCDGVLPLNEVNDLDGDNFLACADCDDACADCYPGASEQCDGKDNDCDGNVPADEVDADADTFWQCEDCDDLDATVGRSTGDPDGDGYDECAGDCDNSSAAVYPGAPEVCDVADNNCDGTIDEGFLVAGRYELFAHCGICNNDCGSYTFANANPICDTALATPACVPNCVAGYFDANGDPDDGCECLYIGASDKPFDGIDADCSGDDGDHSNAVHVALWGRTNGAGTLTDPLLSVQDGADMADTQGKGFVLVAQGAYYESVVLPAGVSLVGGYSYFFDDYDAAFFEAVIDGRNTTTAAPGAVTLACDGSPQRIQGLTLRGTTPDDPGESSYGLHLTDCDSNLEIEATNVSARAGANGTAGSYGIDGDTGIAGRDGNDARMAPCNQNPRGGDGGVLVCSTPSINGNISGGNGGDTLCPIEQDGFPEEGYPGSGGALGGGSGSHGLFENSPPDACYTVYIDLDNFGPGGAGDPGSPGTHGSGGLGCNQAMGQVVNGLFQPLAGTAGATGTNGEGGGGGGAGSGAEVPGVCDSRDVTGGTGAGGGSGGCGGSEGAPGAGAGGSFGVFMVYSGAPGSYPTLGANAIQADVGGLGGAGGAGGIGGNGGLGGVGGAQGDQNAFLEWAGRGGGGGGNGGPGGHGGGGGGGCGGPSFALYVHGATPSAGYGNTSVLTYLGAGAGGAGGYSPGGADGTPGATGAQGATNF